MIYLGYDPGGNHGHGVAAFCVDSSGRASISTALLSTAEAVIEWFFAQTEAPEAIGIDTLTCWSTGHSGWRPADRLLRRLYPEVKGSVASPNSLYGSMSLNGMAVLLALRSKFPRLVVTEAHPKVLHWHFRRLRYDYSTSKQSMDDTLSEQFNCNLWCGSEHEWDAAISALAAYRCSTGQWERDLHALPTSDDERLISPCGLTKYAWPD